MVILLICTMIVYFEITGWALYRCHAIQGDNWWDATKKLMWSSISCVRKWCKKFLELLTEELTGQPSPDKIQDDNLILSNQEVIKLIRSFSGNPFEEPTLVSYRKTKFGALEIDMCAMGFVEKYKNICRKELERKMEYQVRMFYLESRERVVRPIFTVVSPERLTMLIPLSVEAKRIIEKNEKTRKLESAKKAQAKVSPKEAVPDEPEPASEPKPEQETDS